MEFPTDGGGTVLLEVSDSTGGLVTRGGGQGGVFARAQQTFERALSNIRPAVQGVIDELTALPDKPDEVSVKFGLDLHAEAGAFIAAASTSSNFTVTLTWRRPKPALEAPDADPD
ncbi:CU044_2847 family protein [Arthrobacter sp. NPDC058288]|uniref:CU044_2847 family protein n=1 Tax=Arthrobacter sp. NPDC058288 TaxID=3346424 RepID=UPI0036EC3287